MMCNAVHTSRSGCPAFLKPAGVPLLLLMDAAGKVAVTESATWSELQLMSGA